MEELGVDFYDDYHNARDFSVVLKECREAWKGLTEEQKFNLSKTIGGQDYYNSWLTLMDATDDEVRELDKSLNTANGTAKRMADTMMDNVKGSLEEAKGSLETAGIAVQKQLAPYVKDAAGFVKDLANEFSNLDEKQQKQIVNAGLMVAAAGPALKIGGKIVTSVGDAVKGVGNLITDIGKVKAAGGEAVDGVGGLAQVFGKLGPKGIIVTTAIIGLAAIGTGIWAAHEQMIKADIDGHFGDIYLSAKEVEDVAKRLTTTEWSMKVSAVVDAKNELEDIQDTLDGYKKQIDKADWKVSVGLELTQGEIESYAGSVEGYVKEVQKYVEQHQYRASVEVVIDRVVDGIGAGFGLAGSILGFAQGGIVDTPQIAAIAEDGKKEAIIPLENNRARARSLWIEAGRQLQMFPGEAGRDRGYMAGAMREAYENNSYDERMVFEEGSVVINTQAADGGRLYEDVKRRLGAEVQRKKQAYGR